MRTLDDLQNDLGYRFTDGQLLVKAVTHSSHAHESNSTVADNEQLEFLGDAVLGFLVSDFLFSAHPDLNEGQLSKLKGFFVSAANLVKYSEQLHLGDYLQLGKGEEKTGGRTKQALLVDAFEAILGAMYVDGGLEAVRELLFRCVEPQIGGVGNPVHQMADFKTSLQEVVQGRNLGRADYVVTSESGPDHQKIFAVEVLVDGQTIARGLGLTKKAAEQAAAREALNTYDRTHI